MSITMEQAGELAEIFGSLANPIRVQVLAVLADRELTVSEILERVDVTPTALSNHLTKLKRHRLVDCRREHRHLHYFVDNKTA